MRLFPSRRALLTGTSASLAALALLRPASARIAPIFPTPTIEWLSNPLADYLHLLFYRAEKPRFATFDAPGFATTPRLDYLLAVPELVAAAGLTQYADLEPFVARTFAPLPALRVSTPTPRILSYGSEPAQVGAVLEVIGSGAPFYPAFETYWRREVAPQVEAQITAWRLQDQKHHPLQKLAEMHRLPMRSDRFLLAAMPFHPAGSANYSPASVFTGLFRTPDLGRVLGHEASHLLWSEAVGTDWKAHPLAGRAIALAAPRDVDIEESMCLLMQTVLSQAGGVQAADYRVSSDLEGPQRLLVAALEDGWAGYLADAARWPTLIDYVLETAPAAWA